MRGAHCPLYHLAQPDSTGRTRSHHLTHFEDQMFYCLQRGMEVEDAVSLIVNGFCKEVMKELPMEFAVEAQKLIGISLEGSVG